MIILGCNGFSRSAEMFAEHYGAVGTEKHYLLGHDAGAALLVDGELVAAVEEERLNRQKKTSDFPINSIRWVLDHAGIDFGDVDLIAIPWNFDAKVFDSTLGELASIPMPPMEKLVRLNHIGMVFATVLGHDAILADFAARTGFTPDPAKVVFVPHHFAHAMTGYYMAGVKDAAFLISDGRAELLSSLTGEIRDGRIRVFEDSFVTANDSLGNLYSCVTRFLGFVPNNDEYKVMGLAGFGEPPSPNPFLEHFVELHEGGRYTMVLPNDLENPRQFEPLIEKHFGPAEATIEYQSRVAAAVQEMVTVVTRHQVAALETRTDLDHLLVEGGVALNCVNNTELLEGSRFSDVSVSFGASDTGVAIGATVFAWVNHPANTAEVKYAPSVTPYLGPEYDDVEVERALGEFADRVEWTARLTDDEVVDQVAQLLTGKVVIGWFEGRIEHGPRALGHRSILANPNFPDIKDIINKRVKHREPFRPFAPLVMEHDAPRVFEMGRKIRSPYMTFVFPVRPEFREVIPGAVHVDGTSRVQTVTTEQTPRLAALLQRFTTLTDVPCLINTSFNVAGEPIVCSPTDALNCFLSTEIDHLVLGNRLVAKRVAGA
ncbi:carbamoyltransferase C-terminal domain-containing protein [Verrucosispora sp. WMMD1129]|uniref:carbamoyltransferase family protein n=1 Tax=Verrucosispora sp. WMMD1129 TaxID=3016093 RepID=UPI002499AFA0|nr:carbamoyltransferase C-terminal domain-containing protein [Verrucosispora sp. WMMD1129]WFE47778.1 carbamoyltransferase C-terminal domain-containing protein [Verrucosispora sp. WMMD1129]